MDLEFNRRRRSEWLRINGWSLGARVGCFRTFVLLLLRWFLDMCTYKSHERLEIYSFKRAEEKEKAKSSEGRAKSGKY